MHAKIPAPIFYFLTFTWGLPFTLLGLIAALALRLRGYKPKKHGYCRYFEVGENWGGVNLGLFFIVNKGSTAAIRSHEHGHAHPHEHDHLHEQDHVHNHSHDCGGKCDSCASQCHSPMEELMALMQYMANHNAAHARELAELATQLEKAGEHAAYEQVMAAVSDFEKGNMRLSVVLASLK